MAGQHAAGAGPLDEVLELAGEEVVVEALEAVLGHVAQAHQAASLRVARGRRGRPGGPSSSAVRGSLTCGSRRPAQPLDRAPVEGAVGDQVHERREHGDREDDHLDQPERAELVGGSTAHG